MRRFRLIEELEYSEKKGSAYISFGLENAEDRTLTRWNASIFGPDGTAFENRFYQLLVECGSDYPQGPPKIKFFDKVNLPFVGPTGEVIFSKLAVTKTWNREIRMHGILEAIRNEMVANKKLPQPAEGTKY